MRSILSRVMGPEERHASGGLLRARPSSPSALPAVPAVPALPSKRSTIGIVPVSSVDERARTALSTALSMCANRVVAVHVCETPDSARIFTLAWEQWAPGVPLVLLDRLPHDGDPVAVSVADYLSRRHTAYRALVVVAENQTTSRADALEAALLPLSHVVVCRQRPLLVHA